MWAAGLLKALQTVYSSLAAKIESGRIFPRTSMVARVTGPFDVWLAENLS